MEDRIRPTRAGLFAIELLAAVGVFTMCAAVCVGLFARAEVMSRDSADLTRAVTAAQNVAECYKAAGGDLPRTAALAGGEVAQSALLLGYDENWNRVDGAGDAAFTLRLETEAAGGGYAGATLELERAATGETLLSWEIAALEDAS